MKTANLWEANLQVHIYLEKDSDELRKPIEDLLTNQAEYEVIVSGPFQLLTN